MFEKPVISLSTSYLQSKYANDGYAMLCRAAELGYEYVELGHSTTNVSMEGIIKAVEEGVVKVSSLHNFCPIPPFAKGATPNLFSPATKSKKESELWLRHTRNTLEFAGRFGAKAVVCHCGYLSYFFMRSKNSKPNTATKTMSTTRSTKKSSKNSKSARQKKRYAPTTKTSKGTSAPFPTSRGSAA